MSFSKVMVLGMGKVGSLVGTLLKHSEFEVIGVDAVERLGMPFETCVLDLRDGAAFAKAIQNRGIQAHLVINTPSGKLGATTFSITDKAAQVCPTGAIMMKNQGYGSPIGLRLYDRESVKIVGDVAQAPESAGGRRHE